MSIVRRIAITMPASPNIDDVVARLKWTEDNGIPDAWFSDAGAPDTLTVMAAVAHYTTTLRLGVAVTPVYTRTPAVLAASAYVIAGLLPGRFVFGLGSSSQTIMGQWNGVPLDRPLTRVRETAELVRLMLTGAKTDYDGATVRSHGYRQPPLAEPPPIFLAALRPRMIEMAAAVGDGVIFNLWPGRALPRMLEHVKAGAARAGKAFESVEIVNRAMVLCTDDKARGRALFRAAFAPYYATPVYNEFLRWAGHADAAGAIAQGWAEKDRSKTGGALSDALIDDIAVIGDEAEITARIQGHADAGVHTHIIAPLPGTPQEIERTLNAFSAKRFTLV